MDKDFPQMKQKEESHKIYGLSEAENNYSSAADSPPEYTVIVVNCFAQVLYGSSFVWQLWHTEYIEKFALGKLRTTPSK